MTSKKSPERIAPSEQRYLEIVDRIATEHLKKYQFNLKDYASGQEVLSLSREEQADLVMVMLRHPWQPEPNSNFSSRAGGARSVRDAMLQLLDRNLPLTHDRIIALLQRACGDRALIWSGLPQLTKVVEKFAAENPPSPELLSLIEEICTFPALNASSHRKYIARLQSIIREDVDEAPIEPGEAWSDRAIEALESLSKEVRLPWIRLLEECTLSAGSKPSSKWLKATKSLRQEIGLEPFKQTLMAWLPLVDKPRTQPIETWSEWEPDPNNLINERHADILKGLVWLCADLPDADMARALSKLAISAYKKAPGVGPRCVRLGNACVWALGEMDASEAVAQLAFLKVKIKFGTAQKGLDKALTTAAERLKVPRAEIEEMAVPAYGLEAVGSRRETLGDFTAELIVGSTTSVELRWLKPDGKPQKSVPKALKDNFPEELKDLKQAAKDIQKMLPAQRDRIENLYLAQKTWRYPLWRERYLDHPLIGTIARRIIWEFEGSDRAAVGIWHDGTLVDREGQPLDWLADTTQVRLWHPIGSSSKTILAWRDFLDDREIEQPFKQAHRELYLLTPAEETTRVYSNRFAAHIIKQHQFNALCAQRAWKNQLRLMVDDSYEPARRLLPTWGLRAEFWVAGVGDNYGTDTTDAGTFLYLATDRVQFYPIDAAANYAHAYGGDYQSDSGQPSEAIPLERIPAFVFTEIMRDVDLFVGVASVGNDPNWSDGGPEGRHRDYWRAYSFSELSEAAKTRYQVLEKLLPRLKKIRNRCYLQDRFLVARGDIRTYKIHLGSGNILMEPDDRYLCIVPASSAAKNTDGIFLPFEGDRMLAIVLSKAFMLVEDTKIKDETILRQIQP